MKKFGGYAGRSAYIDLSKGKITIEPLRADIIKKYLGGTGYAARVFWEVTRPGMDPLSPENVVIFATGPLTGTLCPCSGSYELCFKSPLTNAWGESRSGGTFGPKMKFAGFDFIIITGRAEKPVYIWANEGEIEIIKAEHLWGKTVLLSTDEILREIDDREASIACIGPAGERLVRFACVINDRTRAAGRCGGGAVLGSKNVKAVVVSGSQPIHVADPKRFGEVASEAEKALLNNYPYLKDMQKYGTMSQLEPLNDLGALPTRYGYTCYFEEANKISGESLVKYVYKKKACFGCVIGCERCTEVKYGPWATPAHGGPEYETVDMLGAWCNHSNLEAIIKANFLCNNYGLDTISTGNAIAFAMEVYERGWLTNKDTENLELKWGDTELILLLIEKIAKREGIGDLLADGVKRVADKLGKEAVELALHTKGLEMPAHDPRAESKILALQYAVAPRGGCHMHPTWAAVWDLDKFDCGLRPFGLPWPPSAPDAEGGVGKGIAFKLLALHGTIAEIACTCIFPTWGPENGCLTPKRYAELISAITGWEISQYELMKIAERVWNLKRCINIREGFSKKDDALPKRMFEPVATGPSKGKSVNDLKGLINEFYEACGWDLDTGVPTHQKLEELDLMDVAETLGLTSRNN